MDSQKQRYLFGISQVILSAIFIIVFIAGSGMAGEETRATADVQRISIFDGQPKTIIVNGYSTSFQWPILLQRRLDRYFSGKRVLTVVPAIMGATPIAKWINVETGKRSQAYLDMLLPKLKRYEKETVIVLAQQSLQGVYGLPEEGIRSETDEERIRQGADALEKYARLLKEDGADLVFVATHIYKHLMEPQIGNERYALDELLKRKMAGVVRGPDLWTPTSKHRQQAFISDNIHPNALGAELMARGWFETLLKYDGLKSPVQTRAQQQTRVNSPAQSLLSKTRVLRDIEYVPGGHERQKLDLYLPIQITGGGNPKALPLIIWVHGGAWQAGNKNNCPARRMLAKGYAVASINYRLSQHTIFPAQIQDCKAAVRWLRANAQEHGIDPNHFGVWGSSAGGHLVALLGTAGEVKQFDVGENLDVSSRVQAVCDFFGPTDFTKMSSFRTTMDHDSADSPESKLVGGPIQQNKDKCSAANPITYISKDDPPFLICHGDKDPLVPHNQSEILYDALKKANIEAKLHTVKGGGHGFRDQQVDRLVEQFFDKHLKANRPQDQ